ncbi:MAG: sugar ABC transporter substrate-binding protein, partial [Deltaproteobacteria bacterium]|nr:sugar ABC transporter substrate-binding protein [Deltaproteobacteria bacterium]
MKLFKKTIISVVVTLLIIGVGGGLSIARAADVRLVAVSHGPDADPFWTIVHNSLNLAAKEVGVDLEYRNPPTADLAHMARLIEQAVASNPDGLIITIANIDVLKGPIEKAIKKGIPVISMNTGSPEQAEELGLMLHVGQSEHEAGFKSGKRAKAAGVTTFLCVNHFIFSPASVDRCQGFADGLEVELGDQMIDSGQDPAEINNKVKAYLRTHPDTSAILTLGPTSAHPTIKAVEEVGLAGKIFFGTFDVSAEISQAIKDGTIAFAIDQQPFLQGYLPVVFLANYKRYGVIPASHISS